MAKKILILRFSSIGDIVLTTPVVRCLSQQLPDAEIHYLTKPAFAILLENNPYIHQLHLLHKHPVAMAAELKGLGFDLIIDLHHNLRTAMIKAVMGVPAYSFDKINFEKFLRVRFGVDILPQKHIVDRYLETVADLGVSPDGKGLDYFIPDSDRTDTFEGLALTKGSYYTWAIGAQHFTKRLPNEHIIARAKQLDKPIVLLGGKEDIPNAEIICRTVGNNLYNACGKLNLNQSAWLVQQSAKLFTNDTGLMHIAAALRVPIHSFWGNTIPEFGMSPYLPLPDNEMTENKNLNCRPCSKIGFDKCPKGHFACMAMAPDSVATSN